MTAKNTFEEDFANNKIDDGKRRIPEIVCMPISIKVFRIYGVFPLKDRLLNPGKLFYIRFVVTAIYCSLILVGSILHLMKCIKGRCHILVILVGYML